MTVEYVVEFLEPDSSFGPGTKIGEIWDARNIGWSRYDRIPGKAFATIAQTSPILPLLVPLSMTHTVPDSHREVISHRAQLY